MSETKPHPTVGDQVRPRKKTWLIIFTVLIAIAAVILLIFAWWWFIQPAFVIDGHKYSKSTYFKMMSEAKKGGINQKEATTFYIETEKQRIAADKLGIKPSVASLNLLSGGLNNGKPYSQINGWQQEVVYNKAVQPAIDYKKAGGYSGSVFFFPFSRLFDQRSYYQVVGKSPTPEHYRDPKYVAEDKEYAKQQLDHYYELIKNNGSVDQTLKELQNNPRLNRGTAANGSASFQTDTDGVQQLSSGVSLVWKGRRINPELFKGKASVGISPVQTTSIKVPDLPGSPTLEASYYFVKFDDYSDPQPSIQGQFDDSVKAMKVEKNV